MSGEETVDERISGRVERRQALDERGDGDHRLGLWDVAVNLKQVKHYVRRPAQDKYYNNKRRRRRIEKLSPLLR